MDQNQVFYIEFSIL